MPIFDQGYQHWDGRLSGHAWRWLAVTRQGVRSQLKKRGVKWTVVGSFSPALGLAAALLGLGVQCVVAATNPVRDDVAATVMVDLHRRLVEGVDVATALRDTAAQGDGGQAFCAYGSTWSRPTIDQ